MSHFVIACGRRATDGASPIMGAIGEPYGWQLSAYTQLGHPGVHITQGATVADTVSVQTEHTSDTKLVWGLVDRATLDKAVRLTILNNGSDVFYSGRIVNCMRHLMTYDGHPSSRGWVQGSYDDAADHGYAAPLVVIAEVSDVTRTEIRTPSAPSSSGC